MYEREISIEMKFWKLNIVSCIFKEENSVEDRKILRGSRNDIGFPFFLSYLFVHESMDHSSSAFFASYHTSIKDLVNKCRDLSSATWAILGVVLLGFALHVPPTPNRLSTLTLNCVGARDPNESPALTLSSSPARIAFILHLLRYVSHRCFSECKLKCETRH